MFYRKSFVTPCVISASIPSSCFRFLAISNFPNRRKEAIEKVRKVADSLAREVEGAMHKDLILTTDLLSQFIEAVSKPYQDAAQQKIDRLQGIQSELAGVEQKIQEMKAEIQNLHVC